MTYAIRSAELRDLDAVLELWRDAEAQPSHTDDVDGLSKLLERDQGALLLAEFQGRPVGSIIAAWDGWRGSIYRLVVATDHRRRGLGRHLLIAAEERLEQMGARRLQAIVDVSDQ